MYRQERVLRKQMQTEGVELKVPKEMGMKKGDDDDDDDEWWVRKDEKEGEV